jgi:hypothetical protein
VVGLDDGSTVGTPEVGAEAGLLATVALDVPSPHAETTRAGRRHAATAA